MLAYAGACRFRILFRIPASAPAPTHAPAAAAASDAIAGARMPVIRAASSAQCAASQPPCTPAQLLPGVRAAYVSIRQHTSAYVSIRTPPELLPGVGEAR
jgi:hypothetical protein